MTVGKMSVSLDASLLEFMAHYQETHQLRSRSEVVAQALTLLRDQELETQYAAALSEWQGSGEADLWDHVAADGLQEESSAAR
ncbi:ribbon-helix-helix domain-containing protein [Deinococcus grandis]|uniref:hypothetical protein n=1 Tax=Deinococcus grandis TaxID=57498 RepID=UPI00073F801C|nr:hypothetical protein [Deinococcus grandis]BBN96889.1 hypothetical protein DEGR_36220 [Deinococcus grandis]